MSEFLVRIQTADLFRMVGWLIAGLLLYAASLAVGAEYPQVQVNLQKLGNVTTFSWVGYAVARGALGRLGLGLMPNTDGQIVGRALVMAAAILAGALGL